MLEALKARVAGLLGIFNRPQGVTRHRIYSTASLVLAVLVVWGVLTAEEAEQLKDEGGELLLLLTTLMARQNTNK